MTEKLDDFDLMGQLARAVAADATPRWIRTSKQDGTRTPVLRSDVVQRISSAYGCSPQEARQALTEVERGRDGSVETVGAVYTFEVHK